MCKHLTPHNSHTLHVAPAQVLPCRLMRKLRQPTVYGQLWWKSWQSDAGAGVHHRSTQGINSAVSRVSSCFRGGLLGTCTNLCMLLHFHSVCKLPSALCPFIALAETCCCHLPSAPLQLLQSHADATCIVHLHSFFKAMLLPPAPLQ